MSRDTLIGVGIIILVLAVVFGLVFSKNISENKELEEVTLKLKWVHQSQFAGNYIAKEKGFYADEGLDLTLEEFTFDNPTLDAVINGNADFGITGADELVIARAGGAPIKAIAVIYKINPVCAYSLKSSGITKPQDFIGKTIGIERNSDGTDINIGILYYAMMEKLGIDRSQINEITIGYDATELISGKTDISTGYIINEPHFAIEQGYEVNTILMADYGVNMYADVLFATDEMIQNRPDLVEKFVRATLLGWEYTIENEEEAVNTVLKYAPERTREHETYMLQRTIPLIHTGESYIGIMEKSKWEEVQQILLDEKMLDVSIDVEEFYTMQFLNKIY